jgi:hypothetical protein
MRSDAASPALSLDDGDDATDDITPLRQTILWCEHEEERLLDLGSASPERLGRVRRRLGSATRKLEAHYQRRELHRASDPAPGSPRLALDDLRKHLAPDEELLELQVLGEEIVAFRVSQDQVRLVEGLMPTLEAEERVTRLGRLWERYRLGAAVRERHETQLDRAATRLLTELSAGLLDPVFGPGLDTLPARLAIVPHRFFHGLPFHAMRVGDVPLMRRARIRYAPSAAVLIRCGELRRRRSSGYDLIVAVSSPEAPEATAEAREIARICPGARLLVDAEATVAAFRQQAPGAVRIHVATHASLRHDNALLSGLRLYDDWLDVRALAELRLRADLVVFSACQTGEGVRWGGDELVGLSHGLLRAGVPTSVLSFWPVGDAMARRMMVDLHRRLATETSISDALAGVWAAAAAEHPAAFDWAPFALIGRG